MIIGACPHCDHPNMTQIAPHPPCYSKEICGECGKEYWLRHSRIDPKAYKEKPEGLKRYGLFSNAYENKGKDK